MASSTAAAICDRNGCPAPAQRAVLLHGQDFYFCGHHAAELAEAVVASAAPEVVLEERRTAGQTVTLAWRRDAVSAGVAREWWT